MTSLLEIAVYDRLPANLAYNMSKKKNSERRRRNIDDDSTNILEYVYIRFFNHSCADTKSFSFYVFVYIINHRTIKLRKTEKKKKEPDLYIRHSLLCLIEINMYAVKHSR